MNKMTKKDYFKVLRELAVAAGNEGAVEFCDKEVERLANRKAGQTKVQKENEVLVERVYEALKVAGRVTVTELAKGNDEMGAYSNQKLSAMLKKLVEAGRVTKEVEKKVSYFKVADEVEATEEDAE